MKRFFGFSNALLVAALAMMAVTANAAQNNNDTVAKVVRINGEVRYKYPADTTWKTLRRGDLLKPGAQVQTAKDSRADLVLGDADAPIARPVMGEMLAFQPDVQQNVVRVWENSTISIDKLNVTKTSSGDVSETELDLKQGHIFGTVKRMSPASSYRVKIPNGVAAIRGTIYDISAEGVLKILVGAAVLDHSGSNGQHISQTVSTDQMYDARTLQLMPLNQSIKTDMQHSAVQTFLPLTTSVMFTPDHTIYPVSTTTGQ